MDRMIPFGKYKGQPIDVLENDQEYANWVAQQEWAKERYPQIVNIIINKFGDNEETPDHNAMQAKFMDWKYRVSLADCLGAYSGLHSGNHSVMPYVYKNGRSSATYNIGSKRFDRFCEVDVDIKATVEPPVFEQNAIDVAFASVEICVWFQFTFDQFESHRTLRGHYDFMGRRIAIEERTWEEYWTSKNANINYVIGKRIWVAAELKPIVGDDYPAIMRQMRNNKSNVLVYGQYSGHGVSEKQFREFFSSQNFRVVSLSEIEDDIDSRITRITNSIISQLKSLPRFERGIESHPASLFSLVADRSQHCNSSL